jgi:rare lipoprotein A
MRHLLAGVMALGLGVMGGCAARVARPPAPPTPPRAWLEEGLASYYGPGFAGRPTASGEKFNPQALTAAHRTLPFGSCLRVVVMESGRSVEVRVNDRGPFVQGRVVDLSLAAAKQLGLVEKGLARVRLYRCAARNG